MSFCEAWRLIQNFIWWGNTRECLTGRVGTSLLPSGLSSSRALLQQPWVAWPCVGWSLDHCWPAVAQHSAITRYLLTYYHSRLTLTVLAKNVTPHCIIRVTFPGNAVGNWQSLDQGRTAHSSARLGWVRAPLVAWLRCHQQKNMTHARCHELFVVPPNCNTPRSCGKCHNRTLLQYPSVTVENSSYPLFDHHPLLVSDDQDVTSHICRISGRRICVQIWFPLIYVSVWKRSLDINVLQNNIPINCT